jgi:hypothetical protein
LFIGFSACFPHFTIASGSGQSLFYSETSPLPLSRLKSFSYFGFLSVWRGSIEERGLRPLFFYFPLSNTQISGDKDETV